ncbi:MAG: M20/M25/M40 family metallo-hydrolase [Planctomycetes bacterium]|nr:M20/M25/M40 family metallo-hydrolase [Planctomycetota bacterium]
MRLSVSLTFVSRHSGLLAFHAWVFLLGAVVRGEESPNVVRLDPVIRADQMRPHIEFLASPQRSGRAGTAKAESRRYIVNQWKSMGLQPLFGKPLSDLPENEPAETFEQAIPGPVAEDGSTPLLGHNIGAWLPGGDPQLADEIVILSAHYDHLGTRDDSVFAGADDNASGVAMLIEAARQMSADKVAPRRSVALIAFDLEERMLWGSRWFAAHPPWPIERVKFFMTADMIGRSLGDLPLPAVFVMGSERAPQLRAALDEVGTPAGLEVCRLGVDIVGTRSDYGPFRDREIPFLFFSTGEHPDYHTPRDTADKINYDKAALIASLMLKVTRQIADAEQPPVWSDPDNLRMEEPRVLHRITTLLLEADSQKPLTPTQRFFVTNVHNRSQKIMDANKMTADDRVWLVRMAQALMVSVF